MQEDVVVFCFCFFFIIIIDFKSGCPDLCENISSIPVRKCLRVSVYVLLFCNQPCVCRRLCLFRS